MWLRIGCEIKFEINNPAPLILMLRPRSGKNQWVARESYTIQPVVPVFEFTDIYGNLCQRLVAPPGDFQIHTTAEVMTADQLQRNPGAPFDEVETLPENVLIYLLPTRYCESDRFIEMANEIVVGVKPGYDQVQAIVEWVKTNVRFNPDSQHFQLSAVEVNQAREGVCRELSHLAIALCRALVIPARMTVGYLHGLVPMDFHAWFEAYVGGCWYVFDPIESRSDLGRVTVASGRDATDVAIFNQFGPPVSPVEISVHVERIVEPERIEHG